MPTYPTGWVVRRLLPTTFRLQVVAVIDGKIYIAGGNTTAFFHTTFAMYRYDPAANSWSTMKSMPAARTDCAGWGVIDGKLYVVGGKDDSGVVQPTTYRYDPVANSWTTRAPLPQARFNGRGSLAVNGQLYVVGGKDSSGGRQTTTYRYDPVANSWSERPPLPAGVENIQSAVVDGKIYVLGERVLEDLSRVGENHCYDPTTDAWTSKTGSSAPTAGATAIGAGGVLHSVAVSADLRSTMVYDPAADSWTTLPHPLPARWQWGEGVAIGDTLYYLGGLDGSTVSPNMYSLTFEVPAAGGASSAGSTMGLSLGQPAGQAQSYEPLPAEGTTISLTLAAPAGVDPLLQPVMDLPGTAIGLTLGMPSGFPRYPKPAQLEILDPDLLRAPTVVAVRVSGLPPAADMTFSIDGVEVLDAQADASGVLSALTLPVNASHAAGEHTVTVESGAFAQSATFTLEKDPPLTPRTRGPDAAPVYIEEALQETGVRKWVLQDLMPGGLGSYVMPTNPTTTDAPLVRQTFQTRRSTAPNGKHHLYESGPEPIPWTLRGYCPDKAMQDQLLAYRDLNRRFYLIDHRNRAWKVLFTAVNLTPRKRQQEDGAFNDWACDYEVSVLVYDAIWRAPQ